MNLKDAKTIAIGGKQVAKIEIGNRVVWRKSATQPDVPDAPDTPEYDLYGNLRLYKEPSYYYSFGQWAVRQGGACYGDYFFGFKNGLAGVEAWNLADKSVCTCSGVTQIDDLGEFHCNNVAFGTKKYDDSDEFPMLYVDSWNSVDINGEHGYFILGYRIQRNGSNFTFTLVQTIKHGYKYGGGGFFIHNGYLWIRSGYYYRLIEMPEPTVSYVVAERDTTIRFDYLPYKVNGSDSGWIQGCTIYGDYFYIVDSPSGTTVDRLYVRSVADLSAAPLLEWVQIPNTTGQEAQSPFVWRDGLYLYRRDGFVKIGEFVN